jgi:hypothetical protein
MKRTTIMVDEGTYGDLEEYARRDGVPTARLIREAMERYVTERERHSERRPLPDFVGALKGGGEPIAGKTREIIAEVMDEVYRTEVRGEPKAKRRSR